MKILTNLKLSFFSYCYKFLALFVIAIILSSSILGILNINPKADAYIYFILFSGFVIFSFTMGIYNYSKLANCQMSTCVDRNGFYFSSIISAIIQAVVCTIIFELCISLVNSYYATHMENSNITFYLEFKNMVLIFVANLAAFSLGSFISLFTNKYYKVCYIIFVVICLFIVFIDLLTINSIDSIFFINYSLTSIIVYLSIIVVTNIANYFKYKK